MENNTPLIRIHMPRFYNDRPIAGLFLFLFRDKIKLCDVENCEYLLTPSPNSVITFSQRTDIKKMWIEEFFLKFISKKLVTEQEKEEILRMISSSDKESVNLGIDLAFNSDIYAIDFLNKIQEKLKSNYKNDKARFLLRIRDYMFDKEIFDGKKLLTSNICGD